LNIKNNPKGKPMKRSLIVLSAFTFLMACNNGPKTPTGTTYSLSDSLKFVNDTTGLAAYQAWKAEHELDATKSQATGNHSAAVSSTKESTHRSTTNSSGNTNSGTASSGTGSSGSTGTAAPAKKGWSKTAKGAVIGGVVGAGAGAVINKQNRAAGAVIGGVVGAGAGAVIGHDMDKKDGRH
jgi:hypothetical protein